MMTLGLAQQLLPGSVLVGEPGLQIQRVHTDTRSLQAGDLFVALQGERFDAHDFLGQIKTSGAVAAIAQHGLASHELAGLEVRDTKIALQLLAKNWRTYLAAQNNIPVIAVTGSNGKTTLTQMVASILQAWQGQAALATRGNFNNDIGVPLTLLALRAWHRCAVLELGMNHVGEIALLSDWVQPTVAVVNNAQREHQEFMKTVAAVASENGRVIDRLPEHGVAVFPADDAYSSVWRTMAGQRAVLSFALAESGVSADVTAASVWSDGAWQVNASTPQGAVRYALHMAGKHNVKNSLAALACALAAQVPLPCIAQGLTQFSAVAGRSRTVQLKRESGTLILVDDTYNANPDSVLAAIDLLLDLPAPRCLILGDMGEVGEQGAAFHAEVGRYARARGIDHFWTLGALSEHAGGTHFASIEALQAALDQGSHPMASVLVKGSRFMKMERLVRHLEQSDALNLEGVPHAA